MPRLEHPSMGPTEKPQGTSGWSGEALGKEGNGGRGLGHPQDD